MFNANAIVNVSESESFNFSMLMSVKVRVTYDDFENGDNISQSVSCQVYTPFYHVDDVDDHYDHDDDKSDDANVCVRDSCGSLGVPPLNVIQSLGGSMS